MMRTLARGGWVVVCGLGMAACSDGFFHDPTVEGGGSRVAIRALQIDDGAQAAFDKADNLSIRIVDGGGGRELYRGSVPITADGGALEVSVDVDLDQGDTDAVLEVDVRRGSDDLFVGASTFRLIAGRESGVSLALSPVPAGLDLPPIPSFTTFGQVVPLEGDVVFATGDPIPGVAIAWESLTPDILTVRERSGGGFEAVALADGEGSLQAGFEATVRTVTAPVFAVVVSAEIVPSSLTLSPGESTTLQVLHFDAAGNPVPGRPSDWTSSDPTVLAVTDVGDVTALALGTVDVSATYDGVTALTVVSVRDPAPSIGSVSTQGVTANGATLVGQVDPRGLQTTVRFEYGVLPDLSDGLLSPPTTVAGTSAAAVPVLRSLVDLLDGTTYYFRIIAENALGRTVSDIFTFTTLVAPQAPSGLTAIRDQADRIRLDWQDNSGDETRFEIERTAGGSGTVIGSVGSNAPSYVDGSPPPGTDSYRVRACNANGCSPWSDAAPAPPPGETSNPGPTVTTLQTLLTGVGTAVFKAQVDAKGRTTSVVFEYGTDSDLVQPSVTDPATVSGSLVGSVTAPVSGLEPGRTYYVRAVATNSVGRAVGAIRSFLTLQLPSAPTGLAATNDGSGGVRLTWTDTSIDESRFELERESLFTGTLTQLTAAAGQSAWVDAAPPLGDLRYRIRSCNAAGCSAFSSWVTYLAPTTAGPLVLTLAPQAIVADGADLRARVDPRGSATTLEFLVDTNADLSTATTTPPTPVAATDPAGDVAVAVMGLQPATQYYVRAVATNADGLQEGSTLSFTTASAPPPPPPPPPPPEAPSDVTVTPAGAAGLLVDWVDNSGNETRFDLERELVGTEPRTVFSVGANVVHYAETAPPVGLVEFRVRACNSGGCSPWSPSGKAYFGLPPTVVLSPIGNVGPTSADATALVTPWQAATQLVFRISADPAFATSTIVPSPPLDAGTGAGAVSLGTALSGLSGGSTYYVRAEATNLWGTSLSSAQSFTTTGGGG